MLGYTPPGQTPSTPARHPWADTPLPSTCWDTPPLCQVHAGIDMATAADGTHPTGMHSCSVVDHGRERGGTPAPVNISLKNFMFLAPVPYPANGSATVLL